MGGGSRIAGRSSKRGCVGGGEGFSTHQSYMLLRQGLILDLPKCRAIEEVLNQQRKHILFPPVSQEDQSQKRRESQMARTSM